MFFLTKSLTRLKVGHGGSKIRLLGQILEKPCVRSRRNSFSLIILTLGQNNCLNEISEEVRNGKGQVKNYVTRSNLKKPCVCSRGHIFSRIIVKLGQNVCLDEITDMFQSGSCPLEN